MNKPSYVVIATVGTSDFIPPDELSNSSGLGKHLFNELKSSFKADVPDYNKLVQKVKKSPVLEELNHARTWGRAFLDWSKDEKKELDYVTDKPERFPLLNPAIQAEDEPDADGKKTIAESITRIILLATDNPQERPNDTVFYAEIIKKYLNKAFPSLEHVTPETLFLQEDAENYDTILREIQEKLPDLPSDKYERIYALPTGGTPAMSSALLIACANRYRARVRVLYTNQEVDKNTGSRAAPRQIGRILYGSQLQHEVESLVNRYDYSGALILVKENAGFLQASRQTQFDAFKALLEHAQARLLFDFNKAEEQLQKYSQANSRNVTKLRAYWPLVKNIISSAQEQLNYGRGAIAELYWHLWVCWQSERYADYLVRLKTLTDRLNIFALETITGIPLAYREALHNQGALERNDFEDLGGLNKAFIGSDQNNPTIREIDFSKNIGDPKRTKKVGFGKETDVAGKLALYICQKVLDAQPVERDVPQPSKDIDLNTATSLEDLLTEIVYEEEKNANGGKTGKYRGGSRVMFNLTKLRNSLPPAHSFGYIDHDLIKAASQFQPGGLNENEWLHQKIGQLLKAVPGMEEFNVNDDESHSPFKQINLTLNSMLLELTQETTK